MTYAVIFKAKEARSSSGSVVTWEGEVMVAVKEKDGWVPATSRHYRGGALPKETKLFRTEQAANRFMKKWKGHPWYAEPRSWEVVEVKRKVRRPVETLGFEVVKTETTTVEDRSHGEEGAIDP